MFKIAWPTTSGLPAKSAVLLAAAVSLVLALSASSAGISVSQALSSLPKLLELSKNLAVKPDFAYLGTLLRSVGETLRMAFIATAVGVPLYMVLGLLAASNTTPWKPIAVVVRGVLSAFRAIPDLVWALAFVAAMGLGELPGIAALLITSVAYLSKFHADSFETVAKAPVDALAAHGASGLAQKWYGVLPQSMPDLYGQWAYSLDANVRSATILGYVGAGGIGYELNNAIRLLQYERLVPIIFCILVIVLSLDKFSSDIRRRVR